MHSKRAQTVNITFKTKNTGTIQHLVIEPTGLKIYGRSEWKVKQDDTDGKQRVWCKLHLAVNIHAYEIIVVKLSVSNMTDGEVLPTYSNRPAEKLMKY
ncbi:Mobile element protein [Candidatus Enterovibrio altilux]|uniref:Mobile element protein n=1 Tax=Candidatus Enterovibrio altilux TaxID=1927128 RepID=A0A291B7C9_9GAMM|nr:Mobile element protein [Candidatus Enterovibrio luxaltus]